MKPVFIVLIVFFILLMVGSIVAIVLVVWKKSPVSSVNSFSVKTSVGETKIAKQHPSAKSAILYDIWTADLQPGFTSVILGGDERYLLNQNKIGSNCDKGIVMCIGEGGARDLTNMIVLIRELRYHGCNLPIEVWFDGDNDLPLVARSYLQDEQGVSCQDFKSNLPFYLRNRNSFKFASIFLSSFKEVLYLATSINIARNPEFLFESADYKEHEALFWPDYWELEKNANCFLDFPDDTKPVFNKYSQEAGQMLVNRVRYTKELGAVLRIMENPNNLFDMFPKPFNDSGKDVLHTTFAAMKSNFNFIKHRIGIFGQIVVDNKDSIAGIGMVQHDNKGEPLFLNQHRANWCAYPLFFENRWQLAQFTEQEFGGFVDNERLNMIGGGVRTVDFESRVGVKNLEKMGFGFLQELRSENWYSLLFSKEAGLYFFSTK